MARSVPPAAGTEFRKTVACTVVCGMLSVEVSDMQNQTLLIILAILFPPAAVFLKKGMGKDLIINIILSLLFYIPGIIHAFIVIK